MRSTERKLQFNFLSTQNYQHIKTTLTEEVFWHCSFRGWSSSPLIWSISAVLRKLSILSWSTETSPAYMKANNSRRSSSLTSLRMMMGCWQGLLWKNQMSMSRVWFLNFYWGVNSFTKLGQYLMVSDIKILTKRGGTKIRMVSQIRNATFLTDLPTEWVSVF